jgi:hypothetical protein
MTSTIDLTAMRAMFTALGVPPDGSDYLVDEGGMKNLEEVEFLKNKDVDQLIKSVTSPGGMTALTNAAVPEIGVAGAPNYVAARAELIDWVPNRGIPVPQRAVMNIKLLVFWLKHQRRISRVPVISDVTVALVRKWRDQSVFEDDYQVTMTQPVLNDKDWPKTMEEISEFLAANHGEQGNPLSYVIRPEGEVPAEASDPSTGYETVDLEMIARGPHTGSAFQLDNRKVWEMMKNICGSSPCYIYIKSAARAKNGREAYRLLFDHFLGANNVGNLATAAEERLQSTKYSGDKRNFDFEKYVRIHTEQHSILNGLIVHGYSGIDESSKVRLLLAGITTSNYDVVKSQILASPALKMSFEKSVELYKDFIKAKRPDEHRNVSEVTVKQEYNGRGGRGRGGGGRGGRGRGGDKRKVFPVNSAPEDKFYSRDQYNSLSDDQKEALRQTRLARGHIPVKRGKTSNDVANSNKAVIAALTARVDALQEANDSRNAGTAAGTGNRNNDALRQRPRGPGQE